MRFGMSYLSVIRGSLLTTVPAADVVSTWETIGRATPLWRTDGPRDPVAHQNHTFGLMAWVPLSATRPRQ